MPDLARAYGRLKKELARTYAHDVDTYCEKKTPFITSVLAAAGFAEEDVRAIVDQNVRPGDW